MSRFIRSFFLMMILAGLFAPTLLHAFSKPFSPTSHSHSVADLESYACAGVSDHADPNYNDVVRIRTTMSWSDGQAQNVRDYADNGDFYTHDITDLADRGIEGDDNLNGWCLWTNFPAPYFDWDDDDGDILKHEESEVVSTDTNFPQANTNYSVNSYFTRWTYGFPNSGPPQWYYDPDGGGVDITPQISRQIFGIGEYDTMDFDRDPIRESYPSKPQGTHPGGPLNDTSLEKDLPSESQSTPVTIIALGDEYEVHVAKRMIGCL